jgi:O-acetylserine/cysteine efflux transporter
MTHVAPRDFAFLVVINMIWGFNLVASKLGVAHFPPVLFTALRFTLLGALVLPFLRWHPGRMQQLLIAALFSGGVCFALLFIGLERTAHASSVAIASQLGVPFTTLLSVLFLGEQVHWRRWLGIGLAFTGVAIIGFEPGAHADRIGLALVVASSLVGAVGIIVVKGLSTSLRPLELQAWFAWTGIPVLYFLTFWLEDGQAAAIASATARDWASVVFTAIAASLIAHTGFYYLVRRYPVTSLSPLTLLSPVFGVGFSAWLLGDPITLRVVGGGLVTLSGVLIIVLRERQIVDTGT